MLNIRTGLKISAVQVHYTVPTKPRTTNKLCRCVVCMADSPVKNVCIIEYLNISTISVIIFSKQSLFNSLLRFLGDVNMPSVCFVHFALDGRLIFSCFYLNNLLPAHFLCPFFLARLLYFFSTRSIILWVDSLQTVAREGETDWIAFCCFLKCNQSAFQKTKNYSWGWMFAVCLDSWI